MNKIVKETEPFLNETRRRLKLDIFDLLARYQVQSSIELELKINNGIVPEHPGWEDFITLENLEQKLLEIEDDIRMIS